MLRSEFGVLIQVYVIFCLLVVTVFGNMSEHLGVDDWLISFLLGIGAWIFLSVPIRELFREAVARAQGKPMLPIDEGMQAIEMYLVPMVNTGLIHHLIFA